MNEIPAWARQARAKWTYRGQRRPDFAVTPKAGEESVWDYPRPPKIVTDDREVVIRLGDCLIARSEQALRVLETAGPPTFYLPRRDVRMEWLAACPGQSWCEWKGEASYWELRTAHQRIEQAAWSYEDPFPGFEAIQGCLSFYPAKLECYVGLERAKAQAGGVYGGWVMPEIVGPYKGEPGSEAW